MSEALADWSIEFPRSTRRGQQVALWGRGNRDAPAVQLEFTIPLRDNALN